MHDFAGRRCALIIGHPGHELRVWGWMRVATPLVAVLTDGSGHGTASRLDLSRDLCRRAAATASSHFGLVTDEQIYTAILEQDLDFFLQLSSLFACWLVEHKIDCVAGDAVEGYNPTHDLCRLIIDRAVRLAAESRSIDNYAFDLVAAPANAGPANAVPIDLSPEDLAAKIDASYAYAAAAGGTLLAEVETLLREQGETCLAREYLIPVDAWSPAGPSADYRPFYETHGEKQVAAGHYTSVIRHREHVWPIARALLG